MREVWTKKKVVLQRRLAEYTLQEPALLKYPDSMLEAQLEIQMKAEGDNALTDLD